MGAGGPDPPPPPLKNHKNIGLLSNTDPESLKNYKAAKPAFYNGPSLARQRNAISMAFRWRADDSPEKSGIGIHSSTTKNKLSKLDPL